MLYISLEHLAVNQEAVWQQQQLLILPGHAREYGPLNLISVNFTAVYCESVNLIGYIIVCYLLIVNSYASAHIARHV